MQIAVSTLAWIGFCVFILVMLAIDLGVFNRRPHEITYKDAGIWSAVWVALALIFAGLLVGPLGWEMFGAARHQKALEFVTGYLIELSLSVDNLFVFVLIFGYFKVPPKYQHRVLFWGVLGALVMRVIMIVAGTELIERFHWIIYVFGAFLIYTGAKMFGSQNEDIDPENRFVVKLVTRYVPIVRHYERRKFFTVVDGKTVGTLLLLVLIVVEFTDLVFALDSIPANLRRHDRSLHRLHIKRFRDPRLTHLLFPARGCHREVSLSQVRSGNSFGLYWHQDAFAPDCERSWVGIIEDRICLSR
jgi:tellurite resistance protein TerC